MRVALLLAVALPTAARSTELTLTNDSETSGASATPCQCFIPGERAAAWLTAPAAGDIVAVQVLWKSPSGGAPTSQEMSITVYDAGTFPTPGAILPNQGGGQAVVLGPMLADGSFNEHRFVDLAQTIPLRASVAQGQTIVLALEFQNATDSNPFGADVAWDATSCQPGRNSVYTGGSWTDACPLGVAGDWVIRAVLEVPDPAPLAPPWALALLAALLGAIVGLRPRANGR